MTDPTRLRRDADHPWRPAAHLFVLTLLLLLAPLLLTARAEGEARALPPLGSVTEAVFEERLDAVSVQQRAASAFGRFGPPGVDNAVDVYRLRFVTTGVDGAATLVPAQLFVPVGPRREPMPLFVFGSGTTGLGDACAPSREHLLPQPLGEYRGYLAPYAARGIVTIFPDYLGFEDPERPQAYFHAISEAHVMLDAARAARAFFIANPVLGELADAVVAGGYSQGGHAAFAAADQRAAYAPTVPLVGLIGFGASIDVRALLVEGPYYAPYVVTSFASLYGHDVVRPEEILAERWLGTLETAAGSVCVDRAQQIYPFDVDAMYTPTFAAALRAGTLEREFPAFSALLAANHPGFSGHGLPALMVQGDQDIIVRNASQERTVELLCAAGSDVLYVNVPGARHRDTRPAGFEAAVAWIHDRVDRIAPPSSCVIE